jgi:nicotinate-nucleotide adenylyltransferase
MNLTRIGILGGTFDPIHVGHVEAALAARRGAALDRVLFIPSRVPPHRQQQPAASPFHRFAMTALTVNDLESCEASDIELSAPGPSYTADTLDRLHSAGLTAAQIFFITGADAFAEIATWHRYPDVLQMAHFVVVSRSGTAASSLPGRLPALEARMRPASPAAAISPQPSILLLDAATPDVSSTDVRRRIRSGSAVSGLVPPAVERHIRRHRLYLNTAVEPPHHTTADQLHGQD